MFESGDSYRVMVIGALALALAAPASAGAALAAPDGEVASGDDLTDVDRVREMAAAYNRHADEINLGPATNQLANNVVNLRVTGAESERGGAETVVYSFRMRADRNITDVSTGADPDANLRMETSMSTVEAVAGADDPAATFRDAYATDEISIEPTSFGKGGAVKWTFWTAADRLKGILF